MKSFLALLLLRKKKSKTFGFFQPTIFQFIVYFLRYIIQKSCSLDAYYNLFDNVIPSSQHANNLLFHVGIYMHEKPSLDFFLPKILR